MSYIAKRFGIALQAQSEIQTQTSTMTEIDMKYIGIAGRSDNTTIRIENPDLGGRC
jgi:hypothetical protein